MDDIDAGYGLLARGEAANAEMLARKALSSSQDRPAWLQLFALALADQARASEAIVAFRELAVLQPEHSGHWQNLGNTCLDLGLGDEALAAFEHAGRLGGAGIEFDLGYGLALMACGRYAAALNPLRKAYVSERASDTCLAYARCLCELERFDEVGAALAGIARTSLSQRQRESLGWILAQSGDDAGAETVLIEMLSASPDHADAHVQYALLLERLNRLAEAQTHLGHESVQRSPPSLGASLACARLRRRGKDHAGALRALDMGRAITADPAAQAMFAFERAKTLDAAGACDEAMAALALAHGFAEQALAARFPGVSAGHGLSWLDERLSEPAPEDWRQPAEDDLPDDPVFLIGFPRSGTTLLENVLDSHPAIASLDERPALEQAIARFKAEGFAEPTALRRLTQTQLHGGRGAYWAEVSRHLPVPPAGRLLDKYPLHLTRAPYIARLFPRSAFVLLLRHPCDCVLSCYMQSFGMNGGVLSFSTLESTARTYADIMSYWEQQATLIATPVHALRYEDLIADFEGELTRLLAFLQLDWHPGIAHYRTSAAARTRRIRTPSYSQVVEPLNRDAVYRWRRYRRHFSEHVLALLEPFVGRYGYTLD